MWTVRALLCFLILGTGLPDLVAARAEGPVQVIAHRGASGHAPENTLAAFRKAVDMQSDYFELDCRLSKDNAVIVLHDADLERVAGLKQDAADLTLAELKALDVGTWFSAAFKDERIPTLRESLAVATDQCGVYVEIKAEQGDGVTSAELVQLCANEPALSRKLRSRLQIVANGSASRSVPLTRAAIAEIRAMKLEKRVVIQSFSPLICYLAHLEAPEIRTELLLSDNKDDPAHYERLHAFALLLGLPGVNVNKDALTPKRLQALRGEQRSVAVWTVNEVPELEHFASSGVTAIITNFPDRCRAVLAKMTR